MNTATPTTKRRPAGKQPRAITYGPPIPSRDVGNFDVDLSTNFSLNLKNKPKGPAGRVQGYTNIEKKLGDDEEKYAPVCTFEEYE